MPVFNEATIKKLSRYSGAAKSPDQAELQKTIDMLVLGADRAWKLARKIDSASPKTKALQQVRSLLNSF